MLKKSIISIDTTGNTCLFSTANTEIACRNLHHMVAKETLCLLPRSWSYCSSLGRLWSTPRASVWWGTPSSAARWSERFSRTTGWSLWRRTSPWTSSTGRSWRSGANAWESLLHYRSCSSTDTTSGSVVIPPSCCQYLVHPTVGLLNIQRLLFCRVLRKYSVWMNQESSKIFWPKLRLVVSDFPVNCVDSTIWCDTFWCLIIHTFRSAETWCVCFAAHRMLSERWSQSHDDKSTLRSHKDEEEQCSQEHSLC